MDKTQQLIFFVNGQKVVEHNPDPSCTLLNYLRHTLNLTGTKYVCGEGGCGACTVMLSKYNSITDKVYHYSVNACIMPVCAVHGLAVTTTEGIGSLKTRLHPVQEQIAKSHGSQCGFCTPGMVMSMYALLRNNPKPTMKEIEKNLEGNLCRCTGYRPILDGYRPFSKDECAMGKNCCKNRTTETYVNGFDGDDKEQNGTNGPIYEPTQEPIFPPELKINYKTYNKKSLVFEHRGIQWYRPVTLQELLELKQHYINAKIVVGNTEIGIETAFKNMTYPILIHASHVPELKQVEYTKTGIKFGASVTLAAVEDILENAINNKPENQTRVFLAVIEILKWFAGKQIRNTAAIGGNIITASPISDLNPIFQSCHVNLEVISRGKTIRVVPMNEEFFTGYRQTQVKPEEIILSVTIPYSTENEYIHSYKQSLRKDDDIAIVNAGMRVIFTKESNIIENIYLSFGGMAPTTVMARQTMNKLKGKKWDEDLTPLVCECLEKDLPLSSDAPGGIVAYRKTLTTSFFFKFYMSVAQHLSKQVIGNVTDIPKYDLSAIEISDHGVSRGTQVYEMVDGEPYINTSLGKPLEHSSAYQQATGEAIYIDDMLPVQGELHVVPVFSTRAHAVIENVDTSAALAVPGVKCYIDHKDINGLNYIQMMKEKLIAVDEVESEGILIGGVVATSKDAAKRARNLVKVQYRDLPAILTISSAINNNSYLDPPFVIETGDIASGFLNCEKILEGEVYMGGQEHFYLETQSSIAVPKENREIDVYSSTQAPTATQGSVAEILGIPRNKVRIIIKRLGGGFGGKETHCITVAGLAILGAVKLNKPVRCVLDRDDDMIMTGGRHPILAKYKVGYSSDGRITTMEVNVYLNCGNSFDLSVNVMKSVVYKIDNAYKIANCKITGHLCKTNIRSNTAFRGFGTVQAIFVMETIVDHVARHEGLDPVKVRELNFYTEGDRTYANQILTNCNIQNCWDDCLKESKYHQRLEMIRCFNRDNRWRKRGMSLVPLKYGISFERLFLNQGGALVNVYTDGSVLLAHGGIEMGQGLHIKMIQIASTTLGIPVDRINIIETGTNTVPNSTTTAASTGSDLNGMAVKAACEEINNRLAPFKNKGSDWDDWVQNAYMDRVSLSATGFYRTPDLGYDEKTDSKNVFAYFSYGAACSEVEIDCLTGDHTILRSDIVMDVGYSLNPAIDIGQIEGAFVQGCGLLMLEQYKISQSGNLLTKGPGAYKIPSIGNIPKIFNVAFLKGKPNPKAVYSSKAIGEPPLLLATSVFLATKSAISAARSDNGYTGYFRLDSPATPDVIRMACQDKFSKQFPVKEEDIHKSWFIQQL